MKSDLYGLFVPENSAAQEISQRLAQALIASTEDGLPKHIQLGNALVALIRSGDLKPGDQVFPEQQLASVAGMSLGTTQKALNRLAIEGWVVRKHGHGTFVANAQRSIAEVWRFQYLDHFRFRDRVAQRLLPVHTELMQREIVTGPVICRSFLGNDPAGFVQVTRRIDVDAKFCCLSRMYLRASRFRALMQLPAHAFENVNLKEIFVEQFQAPTTGVSQSVGVETFDSWLCEFLSVPPLTAGLVLRIEATTTDEAPLSYQEIFVPPTIYLLDVSSAKRR